MSLQQDSRPSPDSSFSLMDRTLRKTVDGVSATVAEFVTPKGMLGVGCGMYVEAFEESYPSLDGFSWCYISQQCTHSFSCHEKSGL